MRWIALLLFGFVYSGFASAQTHWAVSSGKPSADEGPKFGYVSDGGNYFDTLFAYCLRDTKEAVVIADVGEHPADGESSFTLTVSGEPSVTIRGKAEPSIYGDNWLKVRLPLEHPMFELLSKGQPMTYVAGSTRVSLSASNLAATVLQWRNACR